MHLYFLTKPFINTTINSINTIKLLGTKKKKWKESMTIIQLFYNIPFLMNESIFERNNFRHEFSIYPESRTKITLNASTSYKTKEI